MDLEVMRKQRERMADYFISNQDFQPSVLLHLARMFKCKARLLDQKNRGGSHVRALEARLKADCLAVLPLLQGLGNNQTSSSSIQLHELLGKSLDKVKLTDSIEESDLIEDVITSKLSELTFKEIRSSGFSFQKAKGARPNLESANSAAKQVVHAIESLKQENHKDRLELISKLDELIKVTIAKDEKQKTESPNAAPIAKSGLSFHFENQETPAKKSKGFNFNFSPDPNEKADSSLLCTFESNKTTTSSSVFGISLSSSGGKSEFESSKTRPIPARVTLASTTTNLFGILTSKPMTSTESTRSAGAEMTFGNTMSWPNFNTATPATNTTNSIFGSHAIASASGIQANATPSFGLFSTQANSQPIHFPATFSTAAPAPTSTNGSSLFGNVNPFMSNSSFGQTAAPNANLFSPNSIANSQSGNIFGPKTAAIAPIIASLKDDGPKEIGVSVLTMNKSSPVSLSVANKSRQQPLLKTNSNIALEASGTFISGEKSASKGEQETSMETSPNKTKTIDATPSCTTTNVFRAKDDSGWTVLHSACADGYLNFVKFLVEKGADVNAKNESNESVLHYSCAFGKMDIVEFLVEKGADVNVKGYNGATALHYAARNNQWDIVKYLVGMGANVQAKDDDDEETTLHFAALRNERDIVEFLVDKGADVNATNRIGKSALHLCCFGSDTTRVMRYLLENRAKVCAKDICGETALHYASQYGHFDVMKFLVDNGADINTENNYGETALHFASRSSNLDKVKFLIERGADIVVKSKKGQTALHFARQKGDLNVVRYLIKKGCRS